MAWHWKIAGFQCHAIQIDQHKNQNHSISPESEKGTKVYVQDSRHYSGHSNLS